MPIYHIFEIEKKCFFILGILDSSKDDFEDENEVYEAIGEVLHEVADKPEIVVRSVYIFDSSFFSIKHFSIDFNED